MSSIYTLTNLQDAAAHAVGKQTFDSGNSPANCVNLALDALVNYAPWSWRHKTASLSYVSGQSYVTLPADFSELVYLRGGTNINCVVIPTSLDRIFMMRQSPASGQATSPTYYAVGTTDQATVAAAETYRLELFPTPGASTANALQLCYLKQIAALSTGSATANIPMEMQSTLWLLARGYAEITENNQPGLNYELAMQDLERKRLRDAMTQPVAGRVHGTVEDQWRGGYDRSERFATDDAVSV